MFFKLYSDVMIGVSSFFFRIGYIIISYLLVTSVLMYVEVMKLNQVELNPNFSPTLTFQEASHLKSN